MENYLTEVEQDMLGRDLHTLEVLGPLLADMLEPTTPSSGTNAGRPAKRPGSRPPAVLRVMQVRMDVGVRMARWCMRLASTAGVGAPGGNEMHVVAAHLHAQLPVISEMPWARELAGHIAQSAREVADLVDPPAPAAAPDAPPRTPVAEQWGTELEMARACEVLGVRVSRRSIRRWGEQGAIGVRHDDDGGRKYRLAEVVEWARGMDERTAATRATDHGAAL
ncbi:hypothetical protein ACFORJ_07900 [Corynebacterium hansenii]|uniref:Helix-turn-helix domain-containing protein n=1 Tax=Corynebacterium hansenii TaxID=394964 RepID=A0ABV7ZS89_9CORY|nr:hypothetical protein [Corynebacterium hansenii]WJZ00673.1 hypothetical protein CHAN_10360 [Corynebacterium hansenii]